MQQAPALRRPPPQSDVDAARNLYHLGFACLPFLWLVNYVYYYSTLANEAAPAPMKSHIRRSMLYFVAFVALWVVWLVIFYLQLHKGLSWPKALLLYDPSKASW